MTTLDEIEAKLAAAVSRYLGKPLPPDLAEAGQRARAEQDARANDEKLSLEERLQAAFRPFNRAARPWRYLQLFVADWPLFHDPAVAARVLVEQWSDFDAIPHAPFVDLVFPRLSHEALTAAMNAEARKFLDDLPDPFPAYRGQDEGAPLGLSWATERAAVEAFAHGHSVMENPRPTIYCARIAKADVAFVCADRNDQQVFLDRDVILRRPPTVWKITPEIEPTIVKRKRGRPSKRELARQEAYAGYLRRLKAGPRPEEGVLIQQERPKRERRPPDKRPARIQAQENLAMALALALREARQSSGGKRRFSREESLQFLRDRKEAAAKVFGIRPEFLSEEQIYDIAVKTGRILNSKFFRGYIFDMAVAQGKLKPLTDKRKAPRKFVRSVREEGDN
jgi:hypothetical protein